MDRIPFKRHDVPAGALRLRDPDERKPGGTAAHR